MGVSINCGTQEETAIPNFQAPPGVPQLVTRYQFLAAIRNTNRAADLKAHIQGLSEALQEPWLNRRFIFRNSAMIEAARVALSVTNNAVDNLFIAASQIDD